MIINGTKVIVSPDVPKMQLSEGCPVSPEFRVEMNAWMRSFFGTSNLIEDGQAYHMPHLNQICMNPRTFAALKNGIAGESE